MRKLAGEFLYDHRYDILTFKIKNKQYKSSFEFQNFVVDVDEKNTVSGMRIMDVSRILNADKYLLRNVTGGEFKATVKDDVVTVRVTFIGKMRNRIIPLFSREKDFTQQFTAPITGMPDSEVTATV